jgi:maleylacetoacetate isomerase
MMKLYSYFRSSAAYRVRIALNLKGIAYETAFVHLTRGGGEQKSASFRAVNPQALVPALEHDGQIITQSLAIMEYLDDAFPERPLLPVTPLQRAKIRAFALAMACDIHPLNNLRILSYLKGPLGHDQATVDTWVRQWTAEGLAACEALLPADSDHPFCFGDAPGLAEACLVPQMFHARRFDCDLTPYPRLLTVDAACQQLPAFSAASPAAQPDAI